MAQMLIRNVDDSVRDCLRARARRRGHSMAQELREILREAADKEQEITASLPFGTWLASLFGGHGREGDFPEFHGEPVRPADFGPDEPEL